MHTSHRWFLTIDRRVSARDATGPDAGTGNETTVRRCVRSSRVALPCSTHRGPASEDQGDRRGTGTAAADTIRRESATREAGAHTVRARGTTIRLIGRVQTVSAGVSISTPRLRGETHASTMRHDDRDAGVRTSHCRSLVRYDSRIHRGATQRRRASSGSFRSTTRHGVLERASYVSFRSPNFSASCT